MEGTDDFCAMILECNLVGNLNDWFLDSSATQHICSTKEAFATYTPGEFDEDFFIVNITTTITILGTIK